ncbi:hypothetical protein chiPu_0025796, partial [Chiloscyllium punctatum]|nr:hypothetical protein [Chiloscyllium punctatum]
MSSILDEYEDSQARSRSRPVGLPYQQQRLGVSGIGQSGTASRVNERKRDGLGGRKEGSRGVPEMEEEEGVRCQRRGEGVGGGGVGCQ